MGNVRPLKARPAKSGELRQASEWVLLVAGASLVCTATSSFGPAMVTLPQGICFDWPTVPTVPAPVPPASHRDIHARWEVFSEETIS